MSRHLRHLWTVLGTAILLLAGCNPTQPFYFSENGDLSHYVDVATSIDYPDVESDRLATVDATKAPLTLDNMKFDQVWDLSLEEAVKIALENSKVMRTLGGRTVIATSTTSVAQVALTPDALLTAPEALRSIYDPGISETSPFGGVESALSAFDSQLVSSLFWEKNDRRVNSTLNPVFNQDLGTMQTGITKTAATGTQFSMFNNIQYDNNNTIGRELPHDWTTNFEAALRQPLLQGAGVLFNRIAGPQNPFNGTTGSNPIVFNGVMLARINTDITLADFEAGVRNLVSDLENAYWELSFTYRNLEAKKAGRDSAQATWSRLNVGDEPADVKAQAREQYFFFRAEVESALTDLYKAEARVRYIMGLTSSDGRLIRPSDEPTTARVAFEWNEIQCEALNRGVELRKQKWRIKQRELQLIAAKNLLLPRLDAVARYRFMGMGDELISTDRSGNLPALEGTSAFESVTSGDFQEWQVGLQFTMPIGFRKEMSTVRNQQLLLARERAVLQDQELELTHALADAVRDVDAMYALMQTHFNRRVAAAEQVEAIDAKVKAGLKGFTEDVLLDAQRRLADAETAYYRSLADYNRAIMEVHFRKGSLLEFNNVYLAEGPWPCKAYFDAHRRARARDAGHYMNYGYTKPHAFSRGEYEQFQDGMQQEGVHYTTPHGNGLEELPPPNRREPTPAAPQPSARHGGAYGYTPSPIDSRSVRTSTQYESGANQPVAANYRAPVGR